MYENTVQERPNGLIGTVYDWNGQEGAGATFAPGAWDGRSSGFASRLRITRYFCILCVMAWLVPAIHAVQLQQWESFARLLPRSTARLFPASRGAPRGWPDKPRHDVAAV